MPTHFSRLLLFLGFPVLLILSASAVVSIFDPAVARAKESLQIDPTNLPPGDSILRLSIVTSDIIYNPTDGLIYASRPSTAGNDGNSITRINPLTGEVVASVYVGSEPNKLAISDDGNVLYAALDGAYAIRRYDTISQTPGLQFSAGHRTYINANNAPVSVYDMDVAPGNSDLLAITTTYPDRNIAAFNNGVELPQRGNGADYITFTDSQATLFGGGAYQTGLTKFNVAQNGVTDITGDPSSFWASKLKFENGLLFDSLGHVINATTRALVGTCEGVTPIPSGITSTHAFVPNTENGRVLYAVKNNSTITIKAFDTNTFLQIGSLSLPNVGPATFPITMVRYGTNGLALRTDDNQLYFIQTSLIPTGDPLPTPSGTPLTTPTPTPTPYSKFIRQITLDNRDLLYRQADQKFYASVPGTGGSQYGNSLIRIEPSTGTIENSVTVGSNPARLGFSTDEQTLYIGLDGEHAVRKFDMPTQSPGMQFSLGTSPNGPNTAFDIDVLPGDSNSVAIGYSDIYYGAAVYENGVRRTQRADFSGSISIMPPDGLYVGDSYYLGKYGIGPNGLTPQDFVVSGGYGESRLIGNLLYSSGGSVLDLSTKDFVGSFAGVGYWAGLTIDIPNNRIFFLSNNSGAAALDSTLRAYRLDNFLPIGSISLPGVYISNQYMNGPRRLFRWGDNGLAFTDHVNRIFFIQSDLVSSNGTVPSVIQLSAATYSATEGNSTLPVTVVRTGGLTTSSTVDFATSDGTAIAGVDYVGTNGTLLFAPGEESKTINIPIIDDNVYEGNENFNIVISNPTGGAVEIRPPSTAAVTIVENDPSPTVRTFNIVVNEPPTGTSIAVFSIQLSNPTVQTATIEYATGNGSATAGSDYIAVSGVLTFAPLETTKSVEVQILADENYGEGTESFKLNLNNGVNVSVINNFGFASIINYNPNPTATPTVTPTATPIQRTLRVVGGTSVVGLPVNVPITLDSLGNEATVQFSLNFNPAFLSDPTVAMGNGVAPGTTLTINTSQVSSGRIGIRLDSTNIVQGSPPARTLATVTFNVIGGSLQTTPITFGDVPSLRSSGDPLGNSLPTIYQNGNVNILATEGGFEGDVAPRPNGDGVIVATDVTQLRRFATGLDTPGVGTDEGQRADCAPRGAWGDGFINSGDVVQGRRYATGLDPITIVGGPTAPSIIPEVISNAIDELYAYFYGREVKLGTVNDKSKTIISMPVEITPSGDEAAVSFTLEFDANLLANPRVVIGDAFGEDAVLTVNDQEKGRVAVLVDSSTPMLRSEFAKQMVVVTFDVVADNGSTAKIAFADSVSKKSVSDAMGNALSTRWE